MGCGSGGCGGLRFSIRRVRRHRRAVQEREPPERALQLAPGQPGRALVPEPAEPGRALVPEPVELGPVLQEQPGLRVPALGPVPERRHQTVLPSVRSRGRGGSAGGGGGLGARGGTFPGFPVVVAGGQSASDSDRGQGHSNKLTIKHDYVSLSPYQHTVNVRSPRACGRMGWSACRFAGCCAHQGIINKGEQHPRQCDGKYETPHGG